MMRDRLRAGPPTEASRVSFLFSAISPECSCARPLSAASRDSGADPLSACTSNEGVHGRHRRATGGTMIITPAATRRPCFRRSSASSAAGLVLDQVFDHLAEIDRSDDGGRQGLCRLVSREMDVGARLAVDRVLDRSARAMARRQAGHGEGRSLQPRRFHDPKAASPNAPSSANVDSISVAIH